MRYLKQKIAKASEHLRRLQPAGLFRKQPVALPKFEVKIEVPSEVRIEETCVKNTKPKRASGNNVMKNYANAMVGFALSRAVEPYLSKSPLIRTMPIQLFRQILVPHKRKTNCMNP